ncbi:MAG TPA: AI-2E family transporter [Thermoanaerobaculia bacterium]|nr:AI-2E family transporter [Thermoanaerobaculia bacterium]
MSAKAKPKPAEGTPLEQRPEWRMTGIIFFGLIALIVLWATFTIIRPFLTPVLLGAILAVLTFPTYQRVRDRVHGRPGLAAMIMIVAITFLIILPAFVLVLLLVQQADMLIQHLQSVDAQQIMARLDLSHRLEWVRRWIPSFDPASISPRNLVLPVVRQISAWVARNGGALIGGLAGLLVGFFLFVLSTYFFYVEGETIMKELVILSPLPTRYDEEFAGQFKDVIDATFRGHVLTGLAQGVVTTIGLLIAGVPAWLFWGAVATVMSLLPLVGAAAVWVPAAIYLYAAAAMGKAAYWQPIFLTIWGLGAVSVVDNIVRPLVMRGKSQLPAIPLLIAVLGGLQAFGFIGLVIGPLVFSLLMSIIDIYKKSFRIPASPGNTA